MSGPRTQARLRFCLNTYGKIRKYQYIPSKASLTEGEIRRYQYIPSRTSPTTELFWFATPSTYTFRIKVLIGRLCQPILHPCGVLLPLPLIEIQWTRPPDSGGFGPWQRYETCTWCQKPLELWSYHAQVLPTDNANCRVTICSPSPNYMGSWSYEPNTMNL